MGRMATGNRVEPCNPLQEDELTEAEKYRVQQSMNQCVEGRLAGFSFDFQECRSSSGQQNSGQWAVPWSDLMMTMFIFFVVLYVYQISLQPPVWGDRAGADRAAAVIGGDKIIKTTSQDNLSPPVGRSMASLYEQSLLLLQQKSMADIAAVDLVPDKSVRIILSGDLIFAAGSSSLSPEIKRSLREMVPLLAMAPYQIQVVGYAGSSVISSKIVQQEWQLSLDRAYQVASFLMTDGDLAPGRFALTGKVVSGSETAGGRRENNSVTQRVEIILTKAGDDRGIQLVRPVRFVKRLHNT